MTDAATIRRWTRRELAFDGLLAAGLIAVGLAGLALSYPDPGEQWDAPTVGVAVALTVLLHLPLAARRVAPVASLGVFTVLFLIYRAVEVPEGLASGVALFLSLYSAGAHSEHRWRDWVRAAAVAAPMGQLLWVIASRTAEAPVSAFFLNVYSVGINLVFFAVGWWTGDLARRNRQQMAELEDRAAQLAAEREERARRAVVDERVRIARELHDVIAHHVSVMGVQAGAARRVLERDPSAASRALEAIEVSGREAVGELQRLVGFLRSADDLDEPTPQPGIDQLDRLVDQTRAAGLPVELRRVGRIPAELPGSVELAAFRIVQEALTNVLRHAGTVPTTVVLTGSRDALSVEVVNAPGRSNGDGSGSGRGLVGMRERVAMHGGAFEAGPASGGGYRVAARLPLGGTQGEPG